MQSPSLENLTIKRTVSAGERSACCTYERDVRPCKSHVRLEFTVILVACATRENKKAQLCGHAPELTKRLLGDRRDDLLERRRALQRFFDAVQIGTPVIVQR